MARFDIIERESAVTQSPLISVSLSTLRNVGIVNEKFIFETKTDIVRFITSSPGKFMSFLERDFGVKNPGPIELDNQKCRIFTVDNSMSMKTATVALDCILSSIEQTRQMSNDSGQMRHLLRTAWGLNIISTFKDVLQATVPSLSNVLEL